MPADGPRRTKRTAPAGGGGRAGAGRTTGGSTGAGATSTVGRLERQGTWSRFDNPLLCYYGIIGLVIVMVLFGLVMVLSSSSADLLAEGDSPFRTMTSQIVFALIGLGAAGVATWVKPRWYQVWWVRWGLFGLALAAQAGTMIPAIRAAAGGNIGWIDLGFVRFQPAEILKLALCVWMPAVIKIDKARYSRPLRPYARALIGLGFSFALIMVGGDLGTAMIVVLIGAVILLAGGMRLRWWFGGLLAGGLFIALVFISGNSNRLSRFAATYGDCSGEAAQDICYQVNHGTAALVSGGLTGMGLGASREKWSYLPEAHNDFIFAIIGEELGFVGAAAVIVGFMALAWCLVTIALRHHGSYERVVLLAVTSWICGQAFVNIMVVLRILPVIGVPMPFVSAGGTALISCMAAVGLALSMARTQRDIARRG